MNPRISYYWTIVQLVPRTNLDAIANWRILDQSPHIRDDAGDGVVGQVPDGGNHDVFLIGQEQAIAEGFAGQQTEHDTVDVDSLCGSATPSG